MIPKIIHYSWFSGDPFPEQISYCISTWEKKLPEYKFVLWNLERISEIDNVFMKEALSVKKWAFAADYVRLYAIYHYGGIWLDTDVEVFKSFNSLLSANMFIGKESWPEGEKHHEHVYLTSHCFGAERHHEFIKECLSYYHDRHFILNIDANSENDRFDLTTISKMQAVKAVKYGLDCSASKQNKAQILTNGVMVYPSYCFCRPQYTSMKKVYCIHRCAGGWRPNKKASLNSLTDPKKLTLKVVIHRLLYKFHLI